MQKNYLFNYFCILSLLLFFLYQTIILQKKKDMNICGHISYIIIYVYKCLYIYLYKFLYENFFTAVLNDFFKYDLKSEIAAISFIPVTSFLGFTKA